MTTSSGNFRRNYTAHCIEGGVYLGGMAFLSAESVLPAMIKSLGGPDWLVAQMSTLLIVGFILPSLFIAHYVESLKRLMPFLLVTGILQRLPYLFTGLALIFLYETFPLLVLVLVALTPLISGLFGGLSLSAWLEMISRLIPQKNLSSSWAVRYLIAAVMGVFVSMLVKYILVRWPGSVGYGILHLCIFAALMLSYIIFAMIKESPEPLPEKHEQKSMWANLKSFPSLLAEDVVLRHVILARIFCTGSYLYIPFLAIYAMQVLGLEEAFLGSLVLSQMIGGMAGNLFTCVWGGALGGRKLAIIGRIGFLISACLAIFSTSALVFYAIFAIFGIAFFINQAGMTTLTVEISPKHRRPTYIALIAFVAAPAMILCNILSATFWQVSDSITIGASLAVVFLGLSLYLLWRVPAKLNSA